MVEPIAPAPTIAILGSVGIMSLFESEKFILTRESLTSYQFSKLSLIHSVSEGNAMQSDGILIRFLKKYPKLLGRIGFLVRL